MHQKITQKLTRQVDELQIANENLRHQHELAYQETTVLKT